MKKCTHPSVFAHSRARITHRKHLHPPHPPSISTLSAFDHRRSPSRLGETFFHTPSLSLVVNPPIHHARPPSRARRRLPVSRPRSNARYISHRALPSRAPHASSSLARASSRMNEQTLRDQPSASVSRGSSGGLCADARRETRRRDDGRRKNKPSRLVRAFARSSRRRRRRSSSSVFVPPTVPSRRVASAAGERGDDERRATRRETRERETTEDGKRGKNKPRARRTSLVRARNDRLARSTRAPSDARERPRRGRVVCRQP